MKKRALAYLKGWFISRRVPIPVISVGNLTIGGNAKTPMCIFLARAFLDLKITPAIISRGYGRKKIPSNPDPVLVSCGGPPLVDPALGGDEPYLVAKSCPGAIVVIATKRIKAAQLAIALGAKVLIMDDGFQHLALKRDLDILMLSADNPLGCGRVLPAGPLREPVESCQRADVFVTTGHKNPNLLELTQKKPLFIAKNIPVHLKTNDGTIYPLDFLKEHPFGAFCALAKPMGFLKTIKDLGLSPKYFKSFSDHNPYGPKELLHLEGLLSDKSIHWLLTTTKDMVKLQDFTGPLLALEMNFQPEDPESFMLYILTHLGLSATK